MITLTEKDADFIANVIRRKIKELNNGKLNKDKAENFFNFVFPDGKEEKFKNDYMKAIDSEIENQNEELKEYEKILILMMIGSEVRKWK